MTGETRWAETGPNFNPNAGDCLSYMGTRLSATLDSMCSRSFSDEWDYGGTWHYYNCPTSNAGTVENGTPLCRMARYNGDPTSCCLNGSSASGTCNPVYVDNRFSSAACSNIWTNNCNGYNIATGACAKWAEANPAAAGPQIQTYCSANLTNPWCDKFKSYPQWNTAANSFCNSSSDKIGLPVCQEWCRLNPGKCDLAVKNYCDGKPATGICACVNSPVTTIVTSKGSANPKCYDNNCIAENGYKNAFIETTPCQDIVNCEVNSSIIQNGLGVALPANVVMNCGGENHTPTPVDVESPPVWLFILIVVIVVLVMGVGAVVLIKMWSSESDDEYDDEYDDDQEN